jgi:hypothetical protein
MACQLCNTEAKFVLVKSASAARRGAGVSQLPSPMCSHGVVGGSAELPSPVCGHGGSVVVLPSFRVLSVVTGAV